MDNETDRRDNVRRRYIRRSTDGSSADGELLEKFHELFDRLDKAENKLKEMYEYIFVSNGRVSFVEQQRVTATWQRGEKWMLMFVIVFVLGDILSRFWLHIFP